MILILNNMTLEDFFTLTEMKNGLATIARVEELVSRMQQQKDCDLSNVSDTARQWSTVASTLATTESKDCLDHFIKLNGLCFLNCWLQEALKCSNDFADNAVEELLNSLLGSLEKLPIDREQSIASGVHITIDQFLGFNGLNKERARSLSERWKHAEEKVVMYGDKETDGGVSEDDKPKCSADVEAVDSAKLMRLDSDNITCRERIEEGNSRMKSVRTETHNSNVKVCHDASQLGNTNDVLHSAADQAMPSTSSMTADANPNLGGTNMSSSLVSNSCQGHISRIDESSVCPADSSDAIGCHVDLKTCGDASMLKDDGTAKEMKMEVKQQDRSSACKSGQRETSKVLTSSSFSATSPAHKPERSISCNFEENKYTASETMETLPRSVSVDHVPPNHLKTKELESAVQELYSDAKPKNGDDLETSFPRKEVVESDSESEDLASTSDLIVSRIDGLNAHDSSKMGIDQRSELGLEDGELDALEVARQVAIEVEREVVDYREPFCSPSPEGSSGDVKLAQSSLVMEEYKQDQPVKEEVNVNISFPGKTLASCPSPKDDNLKSLETDVEPDTCQDGQPKQIMDAYEPVVNSDRDRCDFDLNEDICNREYDCLIIPLSSNSMSIPAPSVSVSTPIAVSASKGAPLLPIAPLCFAGELGWKGSAATSAFRPAAPRKTDAEKTSAGKKRKSNFIEIDLNVAESGDDGVVIGPIAIKATPVSSGFRSQDDAMEVSSRRADRLKLDLNRLGDDDVSPDQLSYQRFPHGNSEQTLSSASSSSSRQPSMRDIDLNDNPGFFDAIGSYNVKNSSPKTTGMYDISKLDVSAITIMGSRMAVDRKDFLGGRQSLMGTGQSIDPYTIMASRPMLPYTHIPLSTYGYNGQMMGPPMPFTPSVYGPGNSPYMVDLRGTTSLPQIVGGAGVHGAPSATSSFLMSVPNAPLTLNFMGSSKSFFDLNSAMSAMEAANRDAGSFKHDFMQGHNGLLGKR